MTRPEPSYLEPIEYEPITDHQGRTVGWRVPEHEKPRWDNPPQYHITPRQVEAEPVPLEAICASLDEIMFLSDDIRTLLATSYEHDPQQTSRLAQHVERNASTLRNPAGLLVKRLREMRAP